MDSGENAAPSRPLPVAAGIVWNGPRVVVQRRGRGHGAGMLEFPGGKLEPGEGPREALARELVEEWGDAARGVQVGRVFDVVRHRYPPPGLDVLVMFFHVRAPSDPGWVDTLRPERGAEVLSLMPVELPAHAFMRADQAVVTRLHATGEVADTT